MRRSFCAVFTQRMHAEVRVCMSPSVGEKPIVLACSRRPLMDQNADCDYQARSSLLFR